MSMIRKATCVFEPVNATILRLVVIEHEDIAHGGNQVIEMAEVNTVEPRATSIATLTRFVCESGLPFDLAFKTRWNVALGRTRTLEGRLRKILDAYPGVDSCLDGLVSVGPDHAAEPVQAF